jgi:starvation-inducible DNA-binding protein
MAKRPQRTTPMKELTPNIGIKDADRKAVIGLLNKRLSDTVTLYVKTRNYHWNLTGMHFAALHAFFEAQYDQLDEAMDEIAERVRQLGGVALGTLKEFAAHTALEEHPGVVPTAEEMVRALLDDHEAIIRQLRVDVDATAQQYSDSGTSDFLTGLMEAHEKMAWMLRAHLA